MIDLALNAENKPVRLSDIARRQKMSLAYLEQIFCQLRHAELVKSVRGPGGGYLLGKPAAEITAGEIVRAVEGDVDVSQCRGEASCRGGAQCLAHGLWSELNAKMAELANGEELSNEQMISLQFEVGQYNTMMEALSTVTKSMTDMMKSLAQRSS